MSKIKFNFVIEAYNCENYNNPKIFQVSHLYDGSILFKDMLLDLYKKYSQDKYKNNLIKKSQYSALVLDANLFNINYSFVGMISEPSIYKYDNVSLFELEKQFNISNKTFNIMLDPGIGDRVGICRGIHFFFHTNEKDIHHVPHIHCKCGNEEFRVNLNSLEILDKRFKSRKRTKLAIEIIKTNQEELIKYWNNVVINGEKVKFKMYLPHL